LKDVVYNYAISALSESLRAEDSDKKTGKVIFLARVPIGDSGGAVMRGIEVRETLTDEWKKEW